MNTCTLNLSNTGQEFSINWYNPRTGELHLGSINSVASKGLVSLGYPPVVEEKDWVILLRRILK